jgi:hypothetical protein
MIKQAQEKSLGANRQGEFDLDEDGGVLQWQ